MKRQNVLAGALALALVSTTAAADPISEALDAIFEPDAAMPARTHAHRARGARYGRADHFVELDNMVASYYGAGERLNRHTATGEVFRPGGFTAAHRYLPFCTHLSVCYRGCATVRVNDRGPAAWTGRSLDLAAGAARAIGLTGRGVGRVHVTRLD